MTRAQTIAHLWHLRQEFRIWRARNKLARITAAERNSFRCQDYRKRRAAALKGCRPSSALET